MCGDCSLYYCKNCSGCFVLKNDEFVCIPCAVK
jgi:hypothetical protein